MSIGNKLSAVKTVVTSKAGRQLLKGQKHSPTILFAAGVVGFGVTVVMASKATLRLEEVVSENERKQGEAHDLHELHKLGKMPNYSDKDYKKDLAILKVRFCKDVARLYAPAFAVGVLTLGSMTGSHVVLNRRYTGALAAYSALDKSFKEYRGRVSELYGADTDKKLANGVAAREIASEDGSEVSTVYESEGRSPYARLFSKETSQSWSPQADYNLVFLQAQQRYANDLLQSRGHVILNDVYDSLGLERTKAGAVTGWVKNNGDDYIDFGVFDQPDRFHDFMTGKDGALWLDFNVDGIVYDLL